MKYRWKTRPYRHQVEAVKHLLSTGYGGALLMEPRTGKTKTLVDWLSILHQGGKVNRALIVCPVSVIGVWEDEIAAHSPCDVEVVVWDKKGRKTEELPTTPGKLKICIINLDAFAVPDKRSKMGRMALRKLLRKWAPDAMVIDESHRVKSPSAKKTYAIWSVAWEFGKSKHIPKRCLVPYRAIATGTPVTKKKRVFDIYAQWKFLNPARFADIGTFDMFKAHYGVWVTPRGKAYEIWKRNRNVEELQRRIAKDAFMVKREDCFDLPARLPDQLISVDLAPATRKVYDEMEAEMFSQLSNGEITTASIRLVQSLRLMQITSGLAKAEESGKLYALGSEKLDITRDLLSDLFEADEKVVIAARFRGDLQRLSRLGRELGVSTYRVVGGQNRRERDDDIRAFRGSSGPTLMLIQPQAASLGIDLSTASTMIWYSLTNSFVDWSQACDRIALSSKATSFIYLFATNTVDWDAYEALLGDKDLAETMLERRESGS